MTRLVERQGPSGDQYGKLAEDVLMEALAQRRAAGDGEVSLDTKIMTLVDQHIDRLEEDGRAERTIDTYRYCAKLLSKIMGGVRVGEATPARLDAAIRSMRKAHGETLAVQSKTVLKRGLHLAVMANVLATNPVRDVAPIQSKAKPKGAAALTGDGLRELLVELRAHERCQRFDLVDPTILFIATGMRVSEILGCHRTQFDEKSRTLTVDAKLIRATGKGLKRVEKTKSEAGERVVPLPKFAVEMLVARRERKFYGKQPMIFPTGAGGYRDLDNFRARWREVRDDLGVAKVTSHSFRKTVATLIDEEGMSARVGADHLGHSRISMTQDKYMARGRTHTAVADMLDRTVKVE